MNFWTFADRNSIAVFCILTMLIVISAVTCLRLIESSAERAERRESRQCLDADAGPR
jgi:hypothetical protein